MFEDIVGPKKEKVHGHWRRCAGCGMIFDVDVHGETCPVCNTHDEKFDYVSDEEIEAMKKSIQELIHETFTPSKESPYP